MEAGESRVMGPTFTQSPGSWSTLLVSKWIPRLPIINCNLRYLIVKSRSWKDHCRKKNVACKLSKSCETYSNLVRSISFKGDTRFWETVTVMPALYCCYIEYNIKYKGDDASELNKSKFKNIYLFVFY